jgi:hypothetical protein
MEQSFEIVNLSTMELCVVHILVLVTSLWPLGFCCLLIYALPLKLIFCGLNPKPSSQTSKFPYKHGFHSRAFNRIYIDTLT